MEITTKDILEIVLKYSLGFDRKEKAINFIINHQNDLNLHKIISNIFQIDDSFIKLIQKQISMFERYSIEQFEETINESNEDQIQNIILYSNNCVNIKEKIFKLFKNKNEKF